MKRVGVVFLGLALLSSCSDDSAKPDVTVDGPRIDGHRADGPTSDVSKPDAGQPEAGQPDAAKTDSAKVDGPRSDRAHPDLAKVDALQLDTLQPDTLMVDGPPANTIGAAGGTAKSADGKAELIIPAGALTSAVTFSLGPLVGGPAGNLDTAYELGPNGTVFSQQATVRITYDPTKLGGATESNLQLATMVGSAWQAVAGSTVDVTNHRVSGQVGHLSGYGVIAGPSVTAAKVLLLSGMPGSAQYVGASGGTMPFIGVALDSNNVPISGAPMTYSTDKPTVASVDPSTGLVTGGTVGATPGYENVVLTAETSGGIKATQTITVLAKTQSTVVISSATPYAVKGTPGNVALAGAEVIYVQNPTAKVTTDASGQFSAFPPVAAGSFYTFKVTKGAPYLDYFINGWAQMKDSTWNFAGVSLLNSSSLPTMQCGAVVDPAKAHMMIGDSSSARDGWVFYLSSPNALIVYTDMTGNPVCTLTSTNAIAGMAAVFNVTPGMGWIVAKKGSTVKGAIYNVPTGGCWQIIGLI